MKVGLPRAMHFYSYGLLWYTFLEQLGAQVVLSDLTNQKTLETGTKKMVDTACLFEKELLSFPSDKPTMKIDYLFTSPDVKALQADIPAVVASDHRPYIALVEI